MQYCSREQAENAHRSRSSKAEEGRDDQLRGREWYAYSQVDRQTTSDHVEYNPQRLHGSQAPEVMTSIRMVEQYKTHMGGGGGDGQGGPTTIIIWI